MGRMEQCRKMERMKNFIMRLLTEKEGMWNPGGWGLSLVCHDIGFIDREKAAINCQWKGLHHVERAPSFYSVWRHGVDLFICGCLDFPVYCPGHVVKHAKKANRELHFVVIICSVLHTIQH
mmetsp:Transcript_39933/g.96115  ORF Transcript_39933/g.96115 Transcript_39933/m.96115 type:complete len:121 (+) Transcript_39933:67-429(+)